MKAKHLFVGVFAFCLNVFSLSAQQVLDQTVHKDTVHLLVTPIEGSAVQWQISSDSLLWTDLSGANTASYDYVVNTLELPNYFRAQITEPDCDPYFSAVLTIVRDMPTYYWSDESAWDSGHVPLQDEVAEIPEGRRILLDVNTANLGGLHIHGILEFMERDLNLTSDYIEIHGGTFQIGTEENLFQHKALITLTGDTSQNVNDMGTRGIIVMDGILELHGEVKEVLFTKINGHVNAGATQIQLDRSVDWEEGDEIAVTPTDYFLAGNGASVSQKLTLADVQGVLLTTQQPMNAFRWGLLQYATMTGMSLTQGDTPVSPAPDTDTLITPKVLDERATVGNLTRNIVVQSVEDDLWEDLGFGVHIMLMGQEAIGRIDGVEIRRGGQRGRLRRYPIHWHMLSYSGVLTYPDATGQYFRNSVINRSVNRGIVIHGTNGLIIQKNIVFDVEGHAVFTEDAAERRNNIDSNLVLLVRNPPQGYALKNHEGGERGSSGFWISNPDNRVTNNIAADCGTNGFWLSFPVHPWGQCMGVLNEFGEPLNPSRTQFGKFDNNTSHSNGLEGIMLDVVEVDSLGNVYPFQYASTTNGVEPQWPFPTLTSFNLSNYKVWKNSSNGIWDRARRPKNYGVVSADNCGRFFAGSGDDGLVERSLVIGTSLNYMMNGTGRPAEADYTSGRSSPDPVAFATYHSTFDIRNNIAINFPAADDMRSGVFSTDDYYTRALDKGQSRNVNNLIINSHPGVKLYPPAPYVHFALAGALWDPNGIWGPDSNYYVYDLPFFTYGKAVTQVAPSPEISGGVSVSGPFYGFEGFVLHGVGDTPPQNQPWMDIMGIHVRRLDQNLNEVATWSIPSAQPFDLLQHMRHFATTPDGIYELTFPEEIVHPTNFQVNVEGMLEDTDTQVIGVQFDGTLDPIVVFQSQGAYSTYTEVGSMNEVLNSVGETYWQDTVNNRVWVKLRGGIWQYWTNDPNVAVPTNDELLYEPTLLRIFEP